MIGDRAPSGVGLGFENPVADSQAVFRAVLSAMAEPGRIVPCPAKPKAAPLPDVMAAIALTLCDYETPVFVAGQGLAETIAFLAFHTGASMTRNPAEAAFVLAVNAADMPKLSSLSAGTPEYPDRSATAIVSVSGFDRGFGVVLAGPGIDGERNFALTDLGQSFWEDAVQNALRYPLGIDFIFCGPDSLAALPRSSSVTLPA